MSRRFDPRDPTMLFGVGRKMCTGFSLLHGKSGSKARGKRGIFRRCPTVTEFHHADDVISEAIFLAHMNLELEETQRKDAR